MKNLQDFLYYILEGIKSKRTHENFKYPLSLLSYKSHFFMP
jgi:hypothetical protein